MRLRWIFSFFNTNTNHSCLFLREILPSIKDMLLVLSFSFCVSLFFSVTHSSLRTESVKLFYYEYFGIRVENSYMPVVSVVAWENTILIKKLLFKLSGISHTNKTYSTGLSKFYPLMDLIHFSAGNEKIIYWHLYWNSWCVCNEQTRRRPHRRIWNLFAERVILC
jgi:hypothetical protein